MSDEQAPESGPESDSDGSTAPARTSGYDGQGEGSKGRAEDQVREARKDAATYRRRLRDVEVENARLTGVVEGFQRSAVERLAEQGPRGLASGSDLWVAGVELAAVLDDTGRPDPALVAAAVDAALKERPHWRRSAGSADGGARGSAPDFPTSWSSVLGKR